MRFWLATHLLTVLVAVSYVTLGLVAPSTARGLWAVYGGVILVLAALNLTEERHAGKSRR